MGDGEAKIKIGLEASGPAQAALDAIEASTKRITAGFPAAEYEKAMAERARNIAEMERLEKTEGWGQDTGTDEAIAGMQELSEEIRTVTADWKAGIITAEEYEEHLRSIRQEAINLREKSAGPEGARGTMTPKDLSAFNVILGATETKASRLPRGLRTVASSIASLGVQSLGTTGRLGTLATTLGFFAFPHSTVLLGILAGLGALAGGYALLTKEARAAAKALEDLITARLKSRVAALTDKDKEAVDNRTLGAEISRLRREQREIMAEVNERARQSGIEIKDRGDLDDFMPEAGFELDKLKDRENKLMRARSAPLAVEHLRNEERVKDLDLETASMRVNAVEAARLESVRRKLNPPDTEAYVNAVRRNEKAKLDERIRGLGFQGRALSANVEQTARLTAAQERMTEAETEAFVTASLLYNEAQFAERLRSLGFQARLVGMNAEETARLTAEQERLNTKQTEALLIATRTLETAQLAERDRQARADAIGQRKDLALANSSLGTDITQSNWDQIPETLRTTGDMMELLTQKIQTGFNVGRESAEEFAGSVRNLGDTVFGSIGMAFETVFAAIANQSRVTGDQLIKGMLQAISKAALAESGFYFARGLAALAGFPFSPNPGAAALYFKAAALMGAVGAGVGLIGSSIHGVWNERDRDVNENKQTRGGGTIVIEGSGILDMTDPVQRDRLGRALSDLADLDVVVRASRT